MFGTMSFGATGFAHGAQQSGSHRQLLALIVCGLRTMDVVVSGIRLGALTVTRATWPDGEEP